MLRHGSGSAAVSGPGPRPTGPPEGPPEGPREGPTRGALPRDPPAHLWGPSGWAHAGPKWVGPSRAQVGGPTRGPSGWAHVGPKWVGPSQKFGTQKIQKIKILKIKIRSAQNVGKVWISRKKSSWPHEGPSGQFFCVVRRIFFCCSLTLRNPSCGQIHCSSTSSSCLLHFCSSSCHVSTVHQQCYLNFICTYTVAAKVNTRIP